MLKGACGHRASLAEAVERVVRLKNEGSGGMILHIVLERVPVAVVTAVMALGRIRVERSSNVMRGGVGALWNTRREPGMRRDVTAS